MKKALFLVAVATLFFSCQRELDPEVQDNQKSQAFTLVASIENNEDSKANLNSDQKLVWAAGDVIGVYTSDNWDIKNQPFLLQGEGGEIEGTFAYKWGEYNSTHACVAYFPWEQKSTNDYYPESWQNNVYDDGKGNGPIMYFKLRDAYWGYTSGKLLTPLVAQITRSGDEYDPICFKHAGAAVKLTISNMPVGSYKAFLSVPDQDITGSFHVDPAQAGSSALAPDDNATDFGKSVMLAAYNDSKRAFTFVFPVPELTAPKFTFEIQDYNGVTVWSKTPKAQSDLARADILVMPDIDITPYSKFNTSINSKWGLRGTINGSTEWGATKCYMVSDGTVSIAKGITFAAGDEFKVTDGTDWYPLGDGNSNYKISAAGTYDIIFFEGSHEIKHVESGVYDYPAPPHFSSIDPASATDLGATEAANCYIIDEPGSYKIPVVKGNDKTKSAGVVGGVALLWETYCNDQDVTPNSVIAAVDYDVNVTDYIFFKTPDTLVPGNALIAAKDAEGNILWSWHIWIPDTDKPIQTIENYKLSVKYLMDRNLGALSPAAGDNGRNYGMLYQWGRKDPRVCLNGNGGTSYAKTAPSDAISAVNVEDYSKTVLEATQNPTVFYVNNHVWYDSVNMAEELWSPTKTIYDPCPAGWVVPGKDVIATSPIVEDATNGGVTVYGVYFPGTGGASRYSGTWNEGNSYLWSSTTYNSSDKKNDRAHWFLFKDYEGAGFESKEYKTTSAPVRCVKIEGEVPVPAMDFSSATDLSADGSANCYRVYANDTENADKVFKFKAVKGNSNESVGEVASVSLVWETYNNDQTVAANSVIAAVGFDSQYIGFQMPSTLHAGNALIAAKNSSDEILWSWHIWVPETTIAQSTYGISTLEMMDRNLGALRVATASAKDIQAAGMLYQWGRKDPFPNKKVYSSSSNDYTSHATLSSISTDFSVEKNLITLAYSIEHPTVFAAIDDGNTDWTSDEDNKYWDSKKTKYDPCPYGYKVPATSETNLLTEGITSYSGWSYNTGNCSFSAGVSDNFSVFPTGMVYQNGRFDEILNKALIWSSNYESDHRAVGLYVKVEGSAVSTYKRSRANGGSVRCVVDE